MEKRYIYGTNRQLTKYQFLIESETDTEYNVVDVDMRDLDATYKVDKKTLKFTSNNPRWKFIVEKDDFVVSFDEKEIKKQAYIYNLELLEKILPNKIEIVNERQSKLNDFKQLEKVEVSLDDFNKLNFGDEIIVIDGDGNKLTAKCCGFYTTDKINFRSEFYIDGKFISSVKTNYYGDFEIEHKYYDSDCEDYIEYTFSVYLNQKHLDYHLNQQEYESLISRLNTAKRNVQETEKQIAELRAILNNN